MNIGVLIPIRLASERLPQKALRMMCGRSVVEHLLDRAVASRHVADKRDVVVCTTRDASDDCLEETVEAYGCSCFRGSSDDIIRRFHDAIEEFGFDAVIQVDGDDILCDTEYMDLTMDKLLSDSSLGIVTCEGLPLGIASKSFSRAAMDTVFKHYKTEKNDTGFIYFFTKTGLCAQGVVQPLHENHVLDEARLTLDYEEDFQVFNAIFEALYTEGQVFALADVVRYLRAHPEVMSRNLHVSEEYWRRTEEKAQLLYRNADGTVQNVLDS